MVSSLKGLALIIFTITLISSALAYQYINPDYPKLTRPTTTTSSSGGNSSINSSYLDANYLNLNGLINQASWSPVFSSPRVNLNVRGWEDQEFDASTLYDINYLMSVSPSTGKWQGTGLWDLITEGSGGAITINFADNTISIGCDAAIAESGFGCVIPRSPEFIATGNGFLLLNGTYINNTIAAVGRAYGFNSTSNTTYNALLNQSCPAGRAVNGTLPNGTFICAVVTASVDLTNIAFINQSQIFRGNQTINGTLVVDKAFANGEPMMSFRDSGTERLKLINYADAYPRFQSPSFMYFDAGGGSSTVIFSATNFQMETSGNPGQFTFYGQKGILRSAGSGNITISPADRASVVFSDLTGDAYFNTSSTVRTGNVSMVGTGIFMNNIPTGNSGTDTDYLCINVTNGRVFRNETGC